MGNREMKGGARATPITVLSGFLGAGKTTLLNRILQGDHGLRIAVLVNDFGAINIDTELVVGVESRGAVVNLANGCVCCTIRDDLLAAVQEVIDRPECPEYIVLEASGVAEPAGIAATFLDAGLRDRLRLDSIICLLDASQIFAAPELLDLKLRQIAYADMLVLNKTDLVDRHETARIRAWLDDRFPGHRMLEASRAEVPMAVLLGAGRFDASQLGSDRQRGHDCLGVHCEHTDHGALFDTWSYVGDAPLSLDALRNVAENLPSTIYRCKGVVHSIEAPDRRSILQVVGKRVDLYLEHIWGERPPRTNIVAIGAHGTLEGPTLKSWFDSCLAVRTYRAYQ